MPSCPSCKRESLSPRSGNQRARPEISEKNNLCFLFADGLLLSYLQLVVALQSLPLRLGVDDVFKLTIAASPLLAAPKDVFAEAHATDNITFRVLASARVHLLARQKHANHSPSQGSRAAEPALLNAVLVKAEDQNIDAMPRARCLSCSRYWPSSLFRLRNSRLPSCRSSLSYFMLA